MLVTLTLTDKEVLHLYRHLLSHRSGLVRALFQDDRMSNQEFDALVEDKEITSAILDRIERIGDDA